MFVYKRGKHTYSRGLFRREFETIAIRASLGSSQVQSISDQTTTDGRKERVQFDKITARVSRLCYGLDAEHVDAAAITQKVISGVYQGVTTIELDNLVQRLAPPCKTPAMNG